jgi:hypothetical protein
MPWLSARHPIGDTSPLARFVIGLDEALKNYRDSDDVSLPRALNSSRDPWSEDLFYRHPPGQPRVIGPETDAPRAGEGPRATRPDSRQGGRAPNPRFGDKPFDEPDNTAADPTSGIVAALTAVAGLLAAMLWTPAISRHAGREEEHAPATIPTRAKRDDLK